MESQNGFLLLSELKEVLRHSLRFRCWPSPESHGLGMDVPFLKNSVPTAEGVITTALGPFNHL